MISHSVARLRQYLWLALSVPILFGLIGWFVPTGGAPASYKAAVTLILGSHHNRVLNEQEPVTVLLTNAPFYQEQMPDLWEKEQNGLLSRLHVATLSAGRMQLTYTGTSAAEAANTANRIAEAFIRLDQKEYNKKTAVIDQSIQAVSRTDNVAATAVDRERFLYKLKTDRLALRPAELLEPAAAASGSIGSPFTPKKRAVLGVMIGLTLVILWAVFPEFVRERKS
ncbi:hydrolase [Sporolactobacillus sp. Y61]|uniref:Hydrolase n=1 Tax=Sporolactobacillus sp. Y61 TaxID=3160863 RepID=A0AAU8IIX6_9BACL